MNVHFLKSFNFLILEPHDETPVNVWYRQPYWQSPTLLRMETVYSQDWKQFAYETPVVGVSDPDRKVAFLRVGDAPDFCLSLEREPTNPVDPNAIRVMASGTLDGARYHAQVGYLPKEVAAALAGEAEVECRPHCVWLPYGDCNFGLRVKLLIRSAAFRKAAQRATDTGKN